MSLSRDLTLSEFWMSSGALLDNDHEEGIRSSNTMYLHIEQ